MQGPQEIVCKTSAGTVNPAFMAAAWIGPDHPTVIYHHSNHERPFDFNNPFRNSFERIFFLPNDYKANLIALRAPLHDIPSGVYVHEMRDLSRLAAAVASTTILLEALVQRLKALGGGPVIAAGSSIGGWTVNLHRTYFNSADMYVPMFAGANLADPFSGDAYQLITGIAGLENKGALENVLNFEQDFKQVKAANVFPLLGRYYQIARFEAQATAYEEGIIRVINMGHNTGLIATGILREFIHSHLERAGVGGRKAVLT